MPQFVRWRQHKTFSYIANSQVTDQLLRGMVIRELYVNLTGALQDDNTHDITAANLNAADVWGCVKRLDIIVNGGDVIRSFTGQELAIMQAFQFDTVAPPTFAALPITGGTATKFNSTLIIPFWSPKSVKPIDTALDTRVLSELRVVIQWGDVTSITSATGAALSTAPQITVHALESFGIDGPFNTSRIFRIVNTTVTQQDAFAVDLPLTGDLYRSFLIHAQDGSGHDLAGAIDTVKLKSGTTEFAFLDVPTYQTVQRTRGGIQTALAAAGAAELPLLQSTNADLNSWIYFDVVTDGRNSECIDTLGLADFQLVFKTNQTIATLTVLPLKFTPVRAAQTSKK